MARSGILAQSKPAAATNTVLYRAPIDSSASAVLTVANDGTGSTFDVALKEYDQTLTLDASTYNFHKGDVITSHRFELSAPITLSTTSLSPGDLLTSTNGEKTARFHAFRKPDLTTVYVKADTTIVLTVESSTGTFAVGDTLTKGVSPDDTTALIYDAYVAGGINYVVIGPETVNGAGTSFSDGDSVNATSGGSATISVGGVASATLDFVFSLTTAGGVYGGYYNTPFTLFSDRIYQFDVSDSSMSGLDFRLSQEENGEWGPDGISGTGDDGTEYTTGKTTSGTPGTANAYVQYDFSADSATPETFYFYEGTVGTATNAEYGGANRIINTTVDVTFEEMYVYDLSEAWTTSTDSFLIDNNTYTVSGQTSGKWGYTHSWSGTSLNVFLGSGSAAFAGTETFFDSPALSTATRELATVSSVTAVTDVAAENYIIDGKTNAANVVERVTSLVIGPGQIVVVNSTTQNNAFSLVGFEDISNEVTLRNFVALV